MQAHTIRGHPNIRCTDVHRGYTIYKLLLCHFIFLKDFDETDKLITDKGVPWKRFFSGNKQKSYLYLVF